tara:strand:+ start:215 stop:814 length:600 start_codon:yes stop_codon:yes gene_type:complete
MLKGARVKHLDMQLMNIQIQDLPELTGLLTRYDPDIGKAVCLLVREGFTLKEVVQRLPIKSVTNIYSWRSNHEDFREAFEAAKKDAADTFADRILEVASCDSISKEDVPGERLKVESYKWLAEKANPQKYSPKSVISADEDHPLQILIDTGISRLESEGTEETLEQEGDSHDGQVVADKEGKPDIEVSCDGDGAGRRDS